MNFTFMNQSYLYSHCIENCKDRLLDLLISFVEDEMEKYCPNTEADVLFVVFRACSKAEKVLEDLRVDAWHSLDAEKSEDLEENFVSSKFSLKV